VMVGTRADLATLLSGMEIDADAAFPLFLSRLYGVPGKLYLTGPMVGAPYAVMILEMLVALGVKRIVFYGWCGAVSRDLRIGEILLPTEARIDEGTSRQYVRRSGPGERSQKPSRSVKPSSIIQEAIKKGLASRNLPFREGPIWTTDGIFRETRRKTAYHQKRGVLAVEMEASALFSAGRFHGVEVGGILVVSDEIASFKWQPGFRTEPFKDARQRTCEVIQSLCRTL